MATSYHTAGLSTIDNPSFRGRSRHGMLSLPAKSMPLLQKPSAWDWRKARAKPDGTFYSHLYIYCTTHLNLAIHTCQINHLQESSTLKEADVTWRRRRRSIFLGPVSENHGQVSHILSANHGVSSNLTKPVSRKASLLDIPWYRYYRQKGQTRHSLSHNIT